MYLCLGLDTPRFKPHVHPPPDKRGTTRGVAVASRSEAVQPVGCARDRPGLVWLGVGSGCATVMWPARKGQTRSGRHSGFSCLLFLLPWNTDTGEEKTTRLEKCRESPRCTLKSLVSSLLLVSLFYASVRIPPLIENSCDFNWSLLTC